MRDAVAAAPYAEKKREAFPEYVCAGGYLIARKEKGGGCWESVIVAEFISVEALYFEGSEIF